MVFFFNISFNGFNIYSWFVFHTETNNIIDGDTFLNPIFIASVLEPTIGGTLLSTVSSDIRSPTKALWLVGLGGIAAICATKVLSGAQRVPAIVGFGVTTQTAILCEQNLYNYDVFKEKIKTLKVSTSKVIDYKYEALSKTP